MPYTSTPAFRAFSRSSRSRWASTSPPAPIFARVADPKRLKAEIKIAETQAKDVVIGQKTAIDTRNGVVKGQVSRIDPSVQNGTVTVDVEISDPLPQGARPDLSVDGTIELENLKDVLYVGRPVHGQSESTIGLFKLVDDGAEAVRVNVKLGQTSVNTVEVVQGLKAGDKVILSDMSAWDIVTVFDCATGDPHDRLTHANATNPLLPTPGFAFLPGHSSPKLKTENL